MFYFDSAYIAKCYLREHGSDEVLDLAESPGQRSAVALAMVEVHAVFHRHFREGRLDRSTFDAVARSFDDDTRSGLWHWLPVTANLLQRSAAAYRALSADLFLRSSDCLHLVAAKESGHGEIHSNDRHLLAAAPAFGLRGVNVIPLQE